MAPNTNCVAELINWAIENDIPEPNFDELLKEGLNPLSHFKSYGGGFPRNKDDLENNMYVLRLDNSNITYLPNDIGSLSKLKRIDLRDNNITKLPDEICNLENLEILNISDNNLLELPANIVNLKKLRMFMFSGNKNLNLSPVQEEWIKQFKSKEKYG
jgi:Leucine-rich repeat (LRR) protein